MLRVHTWLLMSFVLSAHAAQDECPGTSAELQIVSDAHLKAGRLESAENVTRNCLEQFAKRLPVGHPERTNAASFLGLVVLLRGRPEEAEGILQGAFEQAKQNGQPNAIAAAAAYLGSFYRYRGQGERALPLLKTAHKQMIAAYGPDAGIIGSTLIEIGAVQASDKKVVLAEENFREALRILAKNGMTSEVRICKIYIAAVQVEQGRLAEAESELQRALEQNDDTSALADTTRTLALYHMARLQRTLKREEAADNYFRKAIAAYENVSIQPFPTYPEVLDEYARFLKESRRPEAKTWAAKAKAFRSR